jgi:predicted RNA-binding protein with PUA-like domain
MKSIQEYLPSEFWIMKSEPSVFSFDGLEQKQEEFWDGVRNYQARNFMLHDMKVGHKVLFYHSNTDPAGVAGVCEVIELAKPDLSSLNPNSEYFDPKATPENPRWFAVKVGKPLRFKRFVSLAEIRADAFLQDMLLVRKGQRLSIQPLSQAEFEHILFLGE